MIDIATISVGIELLKEVLSVLRSREQDKITKEQILLTRARIESKREEYIAGINADAGKRIAEIKKDWARRGLGTCTGVEAESLVVERERKGAVESVVRECDYLTAMLDLEIKRY